MRVLLVVLFLASAVTGARILAVFPTNTRSHYAMYGKIAEGLANRGHHITVVSHFPLKHPPTNMLEISLAGTIPEVTNNLTKRNPTSKRRPLHNLEQIIAECLTACEVISNHPQFLSLLNSTETFDLVLVEVFGSECMLPLGERFAAPVVGLLSSVPLPWVNDQLGNPDDTAYVPAYMTGYGQSMNFLERLINTVAVISANYLYRYKSQIPSQIIADRLFGRQTNLEKLAENYSLVISNSHFSINQVRPLVPTLVEVGGLHLDTAQKLPKDIEALLDLATDGVICWSFGSMSKIETIPEQKLVQIFKTFSELPQTILVRMDKKQLAANITVPDNIVAVDWIPQYATLCHPNVKLFLAHGGLLGIQEAVACGTPMLTIPLYADQAVNARSMSDRGVSLTINLEDITYESLKPKLQDLLTNVKYKENAVKLQSLFLDRPVPPLDTALYWIEYVLRHGGAQHLKSPAHELSVSQRMLLDLIVICVSLTLLTIFLLHKLFRYLCTRCIKWRPNKKLLLEMQVFIRNRMLLNENHSFKVKNE